MSNITNKNNNGQIKILLIISVVTVMAISYIVGLNMFSQDNTSSETNSDTVSSELPISEVSSEAPEISQPEEQYLYFDDIDLKNSYVPNNSVADGVLSIITAENTVFPNVNEADLLSFYSRTNKHGKYGLSGTNVCVYEEAMDNIDKFLLSYCEAVPDNSIIIDKAYVSPEGTFKGTIVSNVDLNTQDIDLLSGYSVRFSRFPTDQNYNYLSEQAFKYGLIQRYPSNRNNYTGFDESKSVYRYVGIAHSEYMDYYKFSLEEYIDKLRTEKVIEFDSELFPGKAYVTYYVPLDMESNETLVRVPFEDTHEYSISGDGTRGFIVTVTVNK